MLAFEYLKNRRSSGLISSKCTPLSGCSVLQWGASAYEGGDADEIFCILCSVVGSKSPIQLQLCEALHTNLMQR